MNDAELREAADTVCVQQFNVDPGNNFRVIEHFKLWTAWFPDDKLWYVDCKNPAGENHRGRHKELELAIAMALVESFPPSEKRRTRRRRRKR
jgi:hypothetical protein